MQTTEFIWFDGKLVPWNEAQVHVLTHALHYGSAVFEGIRAYKCADGTSAVFRLQEHAQRLINSGKILRLEIPYTAEQIADGIIETLKANKLAEGYIRPLSFVGLGEMGVYPGNNPVNTIIAVWSWGAYLGPEAGNYVNSILAKIEAKEEGYDEAVMLDTAGFVSEASGENIFIVRNGIIKTTPLTSILGGITRESVIQVARDLGYTVEEQLFTRDELYIADEAFFTGTAAELTPIREVDRRQIGAGHAGPVTKQLQQAFFEVVKGQNPKYASWLSHYSI